MSLILDMVNSDCPWKYPACILKEDSTIVTQFSFKINYWKIIFMLAIFQVMRVNIFQEKEYASQELCKNRDMERKQMTPFTLGITGYLRKGGSYFSLSWDNQDTLTSMATILYHIATYYLHLYFKLRYPIHQDTNLRIKKTDYF